MEVNAGISAVKIYAEGAEVRRRVELRGEEIEPSITLNDLPLSLEDQTARARVVEVKGEGRLRVGALRVGFSLRPDARAPITADQAALEAATREVAVLQEQLSWLQEEIERLKRLPVYSRPQLEGQPPGPSPLAARLAFDDFVDGMLGARAADAVELNAQLKAAQERRRALEIKRRERSDAESKRAEAIRKSVTVELEREGEIEAAILEISYRVPGARWAPRYQLRLDSAAGEAELSMRAVICQATGEDWRGVDLTLSTAYPLDFFELPKLGSIRIGRAQADLPSGGRPRSAPQPDRLFLDFDQARQRLLSSAPKAEVISRALPHAFTPDPGLAAVFERSADVMVGGAAPMELMDDFDEDDEVLAAPPPPPRGGGGAAFGGMPPPAPSMAMMAPAAAPAPQPMMRSASIGGPEKKKRARSGRRAPGAPPPPPAPPQEPFFGDLILSPAEDHARGKLQPDLPKEALRGFQARYGLRGDLGHIISGARARAQGAASAPLPSGLTDVRRRGDRLTYTYEADDPIDVPSDGHFHTVPLGARPMSSSLRYVVVPREDTAVYRLAQLTNPLRAPLISGPAEVYVDGRYVLSTALPTVFSQGEFEMGLGVEHAIQCARNAHFEEVRSGERVVAMTELRHRVELTLANHLPRAVDCEIRERIPTPAPEAEVVVEPGVVEPAWEAYDQAERQIPLAGGYRWRLDIPAKGEQRLEAHYTVKIYANNELVGGNRRER